MILRFRQSRWLNKIKGLLKLLLLHFLLLSDIISKISDDELDDDVEFEKLIGYQAIRKGLRTKFK